MEVQLVTSCLVRCEACGVATVSHAVVTECGRPYCRGTVFPVRAVIAVYLAYGVGRRFR